MRDATIEVGNLTAHRSPDTAELSARNRSKSSAVFCFGSNAEFLQRVGPARPRRAVPELGTVLPQSRTPAGLSLPGKGLSCRPSACQNNWYKVCAAMLRGSTMSRIREGKK